MASNEMNLQQYMGILRAYARLIIGIFIIAIAIACIITYVTPKMYTASTSLNFEFKGENPFADARGVSTWTGDDYITTQIDIIKSLNVAQKVEDSLTQQERNHLIASLEAKKSIIDKLWYTITSSIRSLFSNDRNRAPEEKSGSETLDSDALQIRSPYKWLAQSIGGDMTVEPLFGSRIVVISYASANPQIAALMANKFAEAYLISNIQMIIDPAHKTKLWFDSQLKSLRKKLEVSQSRLTAYQLKEGIIATDERIGIENKRLQELSSQLVTAQQEMRNAVTVQQQLKKILEGGASSMTFPQIFDNPVIQKLKSDIRTFEGARVEVSSRLGVNHPKYKRALLELNAARDRLVSEIKIISSGIDNDVELAKQRTLDLAKALEVQKKLILDLKNKYGIIAVLQREVESEEATYNTALNQVNATSMRSMVDQANVSIVDPASVPVTHSSPRLTINLALGGFGGLLLGVGMAILMEMLTRRVHSKEDVITEMGVPLLGQLKKA